MSRATELRNHIKRLGGSYKKIADWLSSLHDDDINQDKLKRWANGLGEVPGWVLSELESLKS